MLNLQFDTQSYVDHAKRALDLFNQLKAHIAFANPHFKADIALNFENGNLVEKCEFSLSYPLLHDTDEFKGKHPERFTPLKEYQDVPLEISVGEIPGLAKSGSPNTAN